jgi:predicted PurR-regulated permease PerM
MRATVLQVAGALLVVGLVVFLLGALHAIILPILVGAFVAYLCIPMVNWFEAKGAPRVISILLLFTLFILFLFMSIRQIQDALPDEREKLELRVRVLYKVNENYQHLMGLDETLRKGNTLYQFIGSEVDPLVDRLNLWLFPDKEEREVFRRYREGNFVGGPQISDKVFESYVANAQTIKRRMERVFADPEATAGAPLADGLAKPPAESQGAVLSTLGEIVSSWLVTPFVFLFLLLDNGAMRRHLVSLVPNRYFELTLTLVDDLDRAIGAYVRGTLVECLLVGITLLALMILIGVEVQWAGLIAVLAGTANAIPFMGAIVGLGAGLVYALLAENAHPMLPFVDPGSLWVWIVVSVGITKALDDGVFQPVVLGRAVHLHPIVVITGAIGGSILFGVAGMLFAIPAIVVVKVFVTSVLKQLKAYYLI